MGAPILVMTELKGLEHFYSGDETWEHFAACGVEAWSSCERQEEVLDAVGGALELAMVIWHHFDDRYAKWLETNISALGGLSPRECLCTDWGIKRLRECLMRMP